MEGPVLFISRAPNITVQAEETRAVLKEVLPNVVPDIAGAAAEAVTLNRIMGALGGSWFGGYARVAQTLGSQYSTNELEALKQTLNFQAQQQLAEQRFNSSITL